MKMTEKNKVRSLFATLPVINVDHLVGYSEDQKTIRMPDDARIIGAELWNYIDIKGTDAVGLALIASYIGRDVKWRTDIYTRILELITLCKNVDVGTDSIFGALSNHKVVMFPDPLGIEVEEGETLVLGSYIQQTLDTTDATDFETNCLLYYVEL